MTHYSDEEFLELQQRMHVFPDSIDTSEVDEPESSLAKKIRRYCKDLYPALIFPQTQDVRNFLPKGFPDAIIALPKGLTLWIELKSKKGYLKKKQKETGIQLLGLNHIWVCLKTFKGFLQVIDKYTS